MILAVTKAIQIPHVMHYQGKNYSFEPTCEVPNEYGDSLLKNQKKIFYLPDGEVSKEGYVVKNIFMGKNLTEIFGMLSAEDKVKAYDYVKKLAETAKEKATKLPPAKPIEGQDALASAMKLQPGKKSKE